MPAMRFMRPVELLATGLSIALTGVLFAPALASIGLILALAASVWFFFSEDNSSRFKPTGFTAGLSFSALILWLIVSSLFSGWDAESTRLLILKLPLLLLPFLLAAARVLTPWHREILAAIAIWSVYAAATASTFLYLSDMAWYNQLVLESKPMPVLVRMHHIEFSVFHAGSVLAGLWLWTSRRNSGLPGIWIWFTLFAAGMNLITIHLLSARTGLLALYTGLACWALLAARHQLKRFVWPAAGALLIALLAFRFLPSLNNRVQNSLEDLQTVNRKTDPNDRSFAQRVEAWKAAVHILQQAPMTGLGMHDLSLAMDAAHTAQHSRVLPWNRKMPHNQYLESGIQGGFPAVMLCLLSLLLPFLAAWRHGNHLAFAFFAMTALAFVFESLMEQQSGVLWIVFWTVLSASTRNKQETLS
jgi:O-antigen ligase